MWSSAPILFLQEQIKGIIITIEGTENESINAAAAAAPAQSCV
jgi:hypothetical protein